MTFVLNLLLPHRITCICNFSTMFLANFICVQHLLEWQGWFCYYLIVPFTDTAVASFFGAVGVVLVSRIFAVWKKCPITVFLISGIFPLVPGAGVYYTMYYLVSNELTLAAIKGLESLKIAFGIVLGIVFIVTIPKKWFFIQNWQKKRCGEGIHCTIAKVGLCEEKNRIKRENFYRSR